VGAQGSYLIKRKGLGVPYRREREKKEKSIKKHVWKGRKTNLTGEGQKTMGREQHGEAASVSRSNCLHPAARNGGTAF